MVATVRVVRKKGKYPKPITGTPTVKVGFPAGKTDGDIIDIAIWNHYGTSRGIPSRPFLLNAIRKNNAEYLNALKISGKKLLMGTTVLSNVLNKLGIKAQGDVQQEITDLKTPANHPNTIKQKGSSNPLIWSGRMRGAVTWKVD